MLKSFRAEISYWISKSRVYDIQMAPKVLQPLVHFFYFNTIKYKRPHSKNLETPLTGEPIPLHFKELKLYNHLNFLLLLLFCFHFQSDRSDCLTQFSKNNLQPSGSRSGRGGGS
jgi:hypothetical protein